MRRALWGYAGFAGVFLSVLSVFGAYPALGQDTAEAFVAEPDFMRLRTERFVNTRDSLARVDFYHAAGEEDWMGRTGWCEAPEKMTGAAVAAHESDSLALVDFYHAAGGEGWKDRTGWLEEPVMDWYGVRLSEEGRVVGIVMDRNHLTGTISPSLGEIERLKEICLDVNKLTGPIPSELGNLAELKSLSLLGNAVTDSIPASLGRLAKLESLYLGGNDLTGPIPPELGNLIRLETLRLEHNYLTGTIPTSLGGLGSLLYINLAFNSLTGAIPPELGSLAELEGLLLGYNDLTGTIPASLGGLAKLEWLVIDNNSLTGAIPPELGHLAKLKVLDICSNDLTGSIPASLGRLFRLSRLSLEQNNFTGLIPPELGNLAELKALDLGDNDLTGSIPASLGRLAKLESLDLAKNRLTGPIPSELGNLANLKFLNLRSNGGFTGSIPSWLGRLTQLERLWLGGNRLTGPIPPELGNLIRLETLRLEHNYLTGAIPSSLGNLANLRFLKLSHNPLDPYDFPAWIMNLGKLESLDLNGTRLRGAIPPELFDLPIYYLDLSHNDLKGALPDNIANAKALSHLDISDNDLNGLPDLSNLPELREIRVIYNRLTFEDLEAQDLSAISYVYAPQHPVPICVARSESHVTFSVGVGGTANKYQWYREGGEVILGATADTLVAPLSDPPGGLSVGRNPYPPTADTLVAPLSDPPSRYYCKITNAKVPYLTLYSKHGSVYERDTQATLDMKASTLRLSLVEGGDLGRYTLALPTDPGGVVTVTPTSSNKASATVSGALSFDSSNWQAPQIVTVMPVADANLDDDTVTITHAVTGYPCVTAGPVVTVTVADATIIISAEEEGREIPAAFALEQNYPNPFNPSTTIAFTLNKTQRATLSVYDLLGQKVQTLVDGMRPAARYRIPFDASELASGTYLYVLRTEEEIAVRTMLLVK